MRKHTTVNLDLDLLRAAQEALGTSGTTETIHDALREVVRKHRRRWLIEHDLPDLTLESLEELRRTPTLPGLDSAADIEHRRPA